MRLGGVSIGLPLGLVLGFVRADLFAETGGFAGFGAGFIRQFLLGFALGILVFLVGACRINLGLRLPLARLFNAARVGYRPGIAIPFVKFPNVALLFQLSAHPLVFRIFGFGQPIQQSQMFLDFFLGLFRSEERRVGYWSR